MSSPPGNSRGPQASARSVTDVARTIAENATLALFMMDDRQYCTYMNFAAEQMTGFTLAEVIARDQPLHDIIHHLHPDGTHYPLEDCPIDRALPTRAREQGEDVFVHRDGSMYPVAFTASPIIEDGVPIGTVIEVRDLTEEHHAQAVLRASEEKHRFLAESIPAHAWTALPDGSLDYVSQQTAAYFGLPSKQLLAEGWQNVVHPDDLPPVVERWTHSLQTGDPYEVEFRLRRHDGEWRWHLGRAAAQRRPSGAIARWFGTNTDIHDRKEAEEERQRLIRAVELERTRLHSVLMQTPAVIAIYDLPDYKISMHNALWSEFTGRKNAVGKTFDELFPESAGSDARRAFDHAAQSGEAIVGRDVLVPIDRSSTGAPDETYWNFVVQPVRDVDGQVVSLLTHAVEVTEQMRTRQELERRANELAKLGAALERSNRELDQFAYVTSHDLKAPLRGIANLASWIEEDAADQLPQDSRDHLELLGGRVRRMEAMIDGILSYSRAGRSRSTPERVDTEALVRETIELLAPAPSARIDVATPMPVLETEVVPLQQVFLNLIGNALKYGGPEVHVQVRAKDANEYVEVAVVDDGPGIAPEYHERIWGIFQTLEARDKVEGTGIGLSVVRKIVESRGGRAWVESREQQGAAFYFTWPKTPPLAEA